MMRVLASVAVILVLATISAVQSQENQSGFSICGYVLGADGSLVPSAVVHAMPVTRGGLVLEGVTEKGRFCISVHQAGTYRVYAFSDDRGYRNVSEGLFKLDPEGVPEIKVNATTANPFTAIRLRPSPGTLTLKLVDSQTGQELLNGRVIITTVERPDTQYIRPLNSLDKGGEIKLLLPSLQLRIQASAPGYENWSYRDTANGGDNVLRLEPNDKRDIIIRLQRIRKPN